MSYKYFFFDDYSEGTHPRILEAFLRTNLQQERGYGIDSFALENLICVSSLLKPYESVIAPDNGHANVHEAGAIEATGHKINIVPGVAGK